FAQLVVQGLARYAEGLGQTAQGVMRAAQFSGDQRALEGFHLFTEVAAQRGVVSQAVRVRLQVEVQTQSKAFGSILQFADITRPVMLQQQGALACLQFAFWQAVASAGAGGKVLE